MSEKTYFALMNIRHDGDRYSFADKIVLSPEVAAEALADGLVSEEDPSLPRDLLDGVGDVPDGSVSVE